MKVLTLAFALLSVPYLLAAFYLFGLAVLARRSRREAPAGFVPDLRIQVLVPAHNEAAGIARTVKSLGALRYPVELRRLLVIADNCSDETAALARQAGAQVLERHDLEARGKGYALAFAYGHCVREDWCDAVAVVDADTVASENLLADFAAHFQRGAPALQADYGVLNANDSWRTRLLSVAFTLFHAGRSSARERLGLSCGLRGNGMGFRVDTLKAVPHRAFSVVEDLEYGIDLGEAGMRVTYVGSAHVWGEMARSEKTSRSQRRRWEGGRRALVSQRLIRLLRESLRLRSLVLFDLALDLRDAASLHDRAGCLPGHGDVGNPGHHWLVSELDRGSVVARRRTPRRLRPEGLDAFRSRLAWSAGPVLGADLCPLEAHPSLRSVGPAAPRSGCGRRRMGIFPWVRRCPQLLSGGPRIPWIDRRGANGRARGGCFSVGASPHSPGNPMVIKLSITARRAGGGGCGLRQLTSNPTTAPLASTSESTTRSISHSLYRGSRMRE